MTLEYHQSIQETALSTVLAQCLVVVLVMVLILAHMQFTRIPYRDVIAIAWRLSGLGFGNVWTKRRSSRFFWDGAGITQRLGLAGA